METVLVKYEDYEAERDSLDTAGIILAIRKFQSDLGICSSAVEVLCLKDSITGISMTGAEYIDQFDYKEVGMILQAAKRKEMINEIKNSDFDSLTLSALSTIIKTIKEVD